MCAASRRAASLVRTGAVGVEHRADGGGEPGHVEVTDADAERDLEGLEPVRQQLADHLRGPLVGGNDGADADVVVGVHGRRFYPGLRWNRCGC